MKTKNTKPANGKPKVTKSAKVDLLDTMEYWRDRALERHTDQMNAQKREAILNWLFRLTNEVGNVKNMLCNGGALEGALSGDEWDKVHLLLDLLWSKLASPVESLAIPEAFLRRQFSPIIEMK